MSMSKQSRSIADTLERLESQIQAINLSYEDLQVLTYRIASLLLRLAMRAK